MRKTSQENGRNAMNHSIPRTFIFTTYLVLRTNLKKNMVRIE